ncbi:MAG: ATP-binding protein [Ethanoligenens sp.]
MQICNSGAKINKRRSWRLRYIDEVRYMQLNRQEAELFFRLVSERYEHGSIIPTSNKYFGDWGELLSDTVIATALLDRLKAGVQTVPPADIPTVG